MHTKDRLGEALEAIGLADMAARARHGYYDDFISGLTVPILTLIADLSKVGSPEAMALRDRVKAGEFDATVEEAEAWAESHDGQQTIGKLRDKD